LKIRLGWRKPQFCGRRGFSIALCSLAVAIPYTTLAAAEKVEWQLAGAWAEPGNCATTFVTRAGKWKFHEPRDMYGSGFIVTGSEYEGPFGQCHLSSVTQKGDKTMLGLNCHNSVGYSDQVTPIHFNSSNEVLVFSSMDGMSSTFQKCGR
jgi:hypothetical protein